MIATVPAAPAKRGYRPTYTGAGTACPGCGHRGWIVGRRSAQCARCATALPLEPEVAHG